MTEAADPSAETPERHAQIVQHAINNHLTILTMNLHLLGRNADPAVQRQVQRCTDACAAIDQQTRQFLNRIRGKA
jgi:hypothetical protein